MSLPTPTVQRNHLQLTELVEEPEENWILSYLDVFILIAILFIVLTVLSQLRIDQQTQRAQQQQQTLQQTQTELARVEQQLAVLSQPAGQTAIETLPASLAALLDEQSWQDEVVVSAHDDYTELQIRDRILFASAQAELLPAGQSLLTRLAPLLEKTDGVIYVEGHTDNQPIDTLRFQSNWELAATRATTVVQYFAAAGIPPQRLRAVSMADTEPIASNQTDAGRAQNRRVSLLIRRQARIESPLASN